MGQHFRDDSPLGRRAGESLLEPSFAYVDDFNLYYRALKGTFREWLDLVALLEMVLQRHHDILEVKCVTARVSGTPSDQSKPQRQEVNLRAESISDRKWRFTLGAFSGTRCGFRGRGRWRAHHTRGR